MVPPFRMGELVYLRPLEREDLNDRYLGWLNDPEVTRFMETGIFPTTREDLVRFWETVTASPNDVILAVADVEDDVHIGNVKLGPIHWVHRVAEFGIMIGDKARWGRGRGTEATRLMVEYGFEELNLRKITLGVLEGNAAAQRSYEKVGFVVEGRQRAQVVRGGRTLDRIVMGLLREEGERERARGL